MGFWTVPILLRNKWLYLYYACNSFHVAWLYQFQMYITILFLRVIDITKLVVHTNQSHYSCLERSLLGNPFKQGRSIFFQLWRKTHGFVSNAFVSDDRLSITERFQPLPVFFLPPSPFLLQR